MIHESFYKALEIFYNEKSEFPKEVFYDISNDEEYHGYFIELDDGRSIHECWQYLLNNGLIKQINKFDKPSSIYEITDKGKNVYSNEYKLRKQQIKRDNLQIELNKSAIRTNWFIVLTFLAISMGVVFQWLTYRLEKPKEREPVILKQDSLKQRISLLEDSIKNLHAQHIKNN